MASKILKAGGKLLGIGKKKPAETPATAAPAERKGPIITPLGGSAPTPAPMSGPRRRRRGPADTILSDKLGS